MGTTVPTLTLSPTSAASPIDSHQGDAPKLGLAAGIPTAAVALLLLTLVTHIIRQRRKHKRRLLRLRMEDSVDRRDLKRARPAKNKKPRELDITHFELSHPNAPQHEILGNDLHELDPRHAQQVG